MRKYFSWWNLYVVVMLLVSIGYAQADLPVATNKPGSGLWGYNLASQTWSPVNIDASGSLKVSGITSGTGGSLGTFTMVMPDPLNTSTTNFPVASSAVGAPTNAFPVMLYANDNSALQRLFTAIVQGDGVNGNNMLPFAQYLYNGSSFDRAQVKYDRMLSADEYTANLATDTVTKLSSVCSYTLPVEFIFNHQGIQWYSFNAAESAATIQTRGKKLADTEWTWRPGTTTLDIGFIANPTATSSLSIKKLGLTQ